MVTYFHAQFNTSPLSPARLNALAVCSPQPSRSGHGHVAKWPEKPAPKAPKGSNCASKEAISKKKVPFGTLKAWLINANALTEACSAHNCKTEIRQIAENACRSRTNNHLR